ncbi:MAG: type II and III secretion system protein family protein [Alphaproteobacteria bacterium]|nr:type II and III secretion system protein family protein [Alphaproteobacteria bacterium]
MRNFTAVAAAVGALALGPSIHAAETTVPTISGNAPASGTSAADPRGRREGPSQINATGSPILLEIGKGTLVRLPRAASTVFVANPDVADVQVKSPSLVYVSAKAAGETVVYAVDNNDDVLLNAPVRVEPDLSRIRQSLKQLMPGDNISVNSVQGNVVLSGSVANAGGAERARTLASAVAGTAKGSDVVNQLSVTTPDQVNVRVRIAEVDRTVLKELGINWSKTSGNFQFNTSNPTTLPNNTAQNAIIYGIPLPGNTARLNAELDALAQEGLVTNLAEPNLTAVSGQTASFLAGGEFPVPVAVTPATGSGVATITVAFKTFGVALDFTPTIIDPNHVNLRVRPEVSALSTNGAVQISGFSIPALTVRRAETSVELGSGESFALAGLLQNNTEQDVSKIPGLGDIPVLGALFRSDRFQHNETELVIIITPYLVKPSATALASPTDGFVPPHDVQRVMTSDTYRQGLPAPPRGPVPAGGSGLIGPAGFRLD